MENADKDLNLETVRGPLKLVPLLRLLAYDNSDLNVVERCKLLFYN